MNMCDKPSETSPLEHSGPGVGSFVIGVLSVVGLTMLLCWLGTVRNANTWESVNEDWLILDILLLVSGSFIGLCLGIGSASQKNRKKVLGTIGIALNGLVLLCFAIAALLYLIMFLTVFP